MECKVTRTGYFKSRLCMPIDESEIIGNGNLIYWMFSIIERRTKEGRLFCVLIIGLKITYSPLYKIM